MSTAFIKVLTVPKKYKSKKGEQLLRCEVAFKDSDTPATLYSALKHEHSLQEGRCLTITNVKKGTNTLTVQHQSTVFTMTPFEPTQAAHDAVFNAPEVTVQELKDMTVDTSMRFSIRGTIQQVFDVCSSPVKGQWQRKEFWFGTEDCQIRVKLWGAMVDLIDAGFVGQRAVVKNLTLDRYGGKNTMGSTPQTEIVVLDDGSTTIVTEILGVTIGGILRVYCANGEQYRVSTDFCEEDLKPFRNKTVELTMVGQFIRRIRYQGEDIPVLASSGNSGDDDDDAPMGGACGTTADMLPDLDRMPTNGNARKRLRLSGGSTAAGDTCKPPPAKAPKLDTATDDENGNDNDDAEVVLASPPRRTTRRQVKARSAAKPENDDEKATSNGIIDDSDSEAEGSHKSSDSDS